MPSPSSPTPTPRGASAGTPANDAAGGSSPDIAPSSPEGQSASPHFDIDASVVFQLGEHLISDVIQALVELIKNSYDADASYVKITIQTDDAPPQSDYPMARGYIVIEDDGEGMTYETIVDGWLVISRSVKRDMKAAGRTTRRRHRTPLGDKGLGRLGVQRLGHNVEIVTCSEVSHDADAAAPRAEVTDTERTEEFEGDGPEPKLGPEYRVAFSWDDFMGARVLTKVPVTVDQSESPTRVRGTRIVVSGLKDIETWKTADAFPRLRAGLSQLLSPYQSVADFRVHITLNGARVDLAEIGEAVRRTAQVRYTVRYADGVLTVGGLFRLAYFRPPAGKQDEFRALVESDQGAALLASLQQLPAARDFSLTRATEPGWYLAATGQFTLDDLDRVARSHGGRVADPGPFVAEVDGFNLSTDAAREAIETIRSVLGTVESDPAVAAITAENVTHVFDSAADYRTYIKDLSGIRVYRDGFGVRVDHDWLGLASERTSGKSYYSLRPANTLGYVAISARDNANLIEKTDREGFQRTPAYDNFYLLLRTFVGFTANIQDFLRRGWLAFAEHGGRPEPPLPRATPRQIARHIQETIGQAQRQDVPLRQLTHELQAGITDTKQSVIAARSAAQSTHADTRVRQAITTLEQAVGALEERVQEAQRALDDLTAYLQRVSETNPLSAALADEAAGLQERLDEVYSMVSLGLTAEALSHELHNVADQLAQRTSRALARLRRMSQPDATLITYGEYVQSAVAALRRQLSHMTPSLRYVRERREQIAMREFIATLASYHHDRFASHDVDITVGEAADGDFRVLMNRGKLTQVFDNLLLNSEYWLREDLRAERVKRGVIAVDVARPVVRLADNGRGISRAVEHRLFTPFVTAKKSGEGRGLGLFITRQLLEAEGCSIRVLPERNVRGNLFMFEIDFTGALANDG